MYVTPPINVVDVPALGNHYTQGRPGGPRFIVLHATAGTDSLAWLTRTSSPPVSAHRLIGIDGTNYKLVGDRDTAWTCGPSHMGPYHPNDSKWNMNGWALQLELENEQKQGTIYPLTQIQAAGLQVAEWLALWGIMPVLCHYMIDEHKQDPLNFPAGSFWNAVQAYWK